MIEFFCSSEVFKDADAAYEKIRGNLKRHVSDALSKVEQDERNSIIYFIPSIMPSELKEKYLEILEFDKSENSIEFRPQFDCAEFISLSEVRQVELIVSELKRISPLIEKLGYSPDTTKKVQEIFLNLDKTFSIP